MHCGLERKAKQDALGPMLSATDMGIWIRTVQGLGGYLKEKRNKASVVLTHINTSILGKVGLLRKVQP